jgi:hypothetical protein
MDKLLCNNTTLSGKLLCNNTTLSGKLLCNNTTLSGKLLCNNTTLSGVHGFHRSKIIELINIFRKSYFNHLQIIIASDSMPIENLSSDTIYNCLLFLNSYTVTNGYTIIEHLKPKGVLCIIDPSGNDPIHQWIENDYSGYKLVHQVLTYTDIQDEITPRILWMTRRDIPVLEHSMPHEIKIMPTAREQNSYNTCQIM